MKPAATTTMIDANDPDFSARYPHGAIVRDRWGRKIPGVIAFDPETGEVIGCDGTWLTGQWLRLIGRGPRFSVVTRQCARWASSSGGALYRHGFWPAPLTVEGRRPTDVAAIRHHLANGSGRPGVPGVLTLAQIDDLILAVGPTP